MMVCPPPATTFSTRRCDNVETTAGRQALKSLSKEQVAPYLVTGGHGSTYGSLEARSSPSQPPSP
jgi:hypothetical protein